MEQVQPQPPREQRWRLRRACGSSSHWQSWEQAYIGLALTGFALGDMPSANRTWGAYLQKHGFKRRLVEADCTTCYTVADFAREYPHGVYVLGCSGHVLAVIDGKWWDSWDSGAECPIYYWYKED